MFNLRNPFKAPREVISAEDLYAATITAARDPHFFVAWHVPDTPEGRFEMLALSAFLVLKRLKSDPVNSEVAQAYYDVMFGDLDANLRELGVGEMTVGKKIKKLAEGFYGRIRAYENGLNAEDDTLLIEALARYVYRDQDPAHTTLAAMGGYIRRQDAHLGAQPDDKLRDGAIEFCSVLDDGAHP